MQHILSNDFKKSIETAVFVEKWFSSTWNSFPTFSSLKEWKKIQPFTSWQEYFVLKETVTSQHRKINLFPISISIARQWKSTYFQFQWALQDNGKWVDAEFSYRMIISNKLKFSNLSRISIKTYWELLSGCIPRCNFKVNQDASCSQHQYGLQNSTCRW